MAVSRKTGSQTDAKPSIADLSGKEYYFAKYVAGGLALCGAGEQPAGVISEGKAIGLHTSINTGNQLKVVAAGAIAPGAKVASDAAGKAVTAASGAFVYAESIMEVAAAAGDLVEINVTNAGILA